MKEYFYCAGFAFLIMWLSEAVYHRLDHGCLYCKCSRISMLKQVILLHNVVIARVRLRAARGALTDPQREPARQRAPAPCLVSIFLSWLSAQVCTKSPEGSEPCWDSRWSLPANYILGRWKLHRWEVLACTARPRWALFLAQMEFLRILLRRQLTVPISTCPLPWFLPHAVGETISKWVNFPAHL